MVATPGDEPAGATSDGGTLRVGARPTSRGFAVVVDGEDFLVEFPEPIWSGTPPGLRQALIEHLTLATTHFLPLVLGKAAIAYDVPLPVFESVLFQNQIFDMTMVEQADGVEPAEYLRAFHNLALEFPRAEGTLPGPGDWPQPSEPETAIVPFTFGKESLATVALCLELGIEPILVYCQEPAHPHEEDYKRARLQEFGERFGVEAHFVTYGPGLFRYGAAFGREVPTELGWGSQTTQLALVALPFAVARGAGLILIGNEHSNNDGGIRQGWRTFSSIDQSSAWTPRQSNLIRALTGGRTRVSSSLEPLEEINVFHLLHHRYPEIGRYQFSCSAEQPLRAGSQWCHACYKCVRMYLFAMVCGVDPRSIGFVDDPLQPDAFEHYFGSVQKSGPRQELDFAFFALHHTGHQARVLDRFRRERLPHLPPWTWFVDFYTSLKPEGNLPDRYRAPLREIFLAELGWFRSVLPRGGTPGGWGS